MANQRAEKRQLSTKQSQSTKKKKRTIIKAKYLGDEHIVLAKKLQQQKKDQELILKTANSFPKAVLLGIITETDLKSSRCIV